VTSAVQAQVTDSAWLGDVWYYPETDSQPAFCLDDLLPPFFRDEARLKRYIRDERFYTLRKHLGDSLAVDAIFDQAMIMAGGNPSHALWISLFAVMDHHSLGFKLPLAGPVFVPLTAENDSVFRVRRTNLPATVLGDDPKASDRDKLQHFFGSALIAYLSASDGIAAFIGDLFERNEASIVLGGRFDERDRVANGKGRKFGLLLRRDPEALPSDILWGGK
jgi:hypothetical protein